MAACLVLIFLLLPACAPVVAETGAREAFCGYSTSGPCRADSDCVPGGCSGQVCASAKEPPVITTCEWRECYNPALYNLHCACVNGACAWSENGGGGAR